MEHPKKLKLISQLVRLLILPLLALVTLLSVAQGVLFFQSSTESTKAHIENQVAVVLPLLSKALYDADLEAVNLIGDSLFKDPNVTYVMVSDQFSRVFLRSRSAESTDLLSPMVYSRPLSHLPADGQRLLLGNLNIQFRPDILISDRTRSTLGIITLGVIKLLFAMIGLVLFLHFKVLRRLRSLLEIISLSRPDKPHEICPASGDPEEIVSLTNAFNELQRSNFRFHSRQQEAHSKLIEKTNEVAESRESARMLTHMLQNSQKRYRALFHRNLDAMLIIEAFRLEEEERYRVIDANHAAMMLLNQPLEQLIKQDFEAMFGFAPLEHGHRRLNAETLTALALQEQYDIELHFNMVMFDKQTLFYVTLKDIRDRVRVEQLEKEAEDLMNFRQNQMAIGELATTIAHEVNQPLAAIQNYALSAINFSQTPNNAEKMHHSLRQLVQQAEVASLIIQQARAQLGRNDYPQELTDLISLSKASLELCQLRADKLGVSLAFHSTLSEAPVIANEIQIKQLLINLISNAIEAISETSAEGKIDLTLNKVGNSYDLRVLDNGPGIQNIDRVFMTQYSTKEKGLGMGLAICRSIAEIHHGSIAARSPLEGGAEFILKLPLGTPESDAVAQQPASRTPDQDLTGEQ